MADYELFQPLVYDPKDFTFRRIAGNEVISGQFVDEHTIGMTIVAKVLRDLMPGEVPGTKNTPYTDYPYRNSITHNKVTSLPPTARRVNNLVTGTVETLGGKWYLGTFIDTKFPDVGEYPIYFYEVDKPAEGTIAVDYFRTVERRNGSIEYWYEGTTYRTSSNDKIRFTSDRFNIVHGNSYTRSDPKEPKPTDEVKHTVYIIIRKLALNEVPQNVITSPQSRTIIGEDRFTAAANSSVYLN